METESSSHRPSPAEAREALAVVSAEEAATVHRPVPVWYFPVLALLVLALFVLNAVDTPALPLRAGLVALTVGTAVLIAALVGRVSLHHPAYRGVRVPWGPTLVGSLVAGVIAVTPVLLADVVGAWIWMACGLLLAGLIAGFGVDYRRRYRRG